MAVLHDPASIAAAAATTEPAVPAAAASQAFTTESGDRSLAITSAVPGTSCGSRPRYYHSSISYPPTSKGFLAGNKNNSELSVTSVNKNSEAIDSRASDIGTLRGR